MLTLLVTVASRGVVEGELHATIACGPAVFVVWAALS